MSPLPDDVEVSVEPASTEVESPPVPGGERRLVQVGVPSPLYGAFDYVWAHPTPPRPGTRVRVPFGRRQVSGVLVAEIERSDVPSGRLRKVGRVLDAEPVLPPELLSLLLWASRYYHHPVGEVLAGALPVLLRRGAPAEITRRESYRLTAAGRAADPAEVSPRGRRSSRRC